MKNVMVVGGAGFIGSNLVRRLLAMPSIEHVAVVDNYQSAAKEILPILNPKLKIYEAPVESLGKFDGIDTLFHLASNSDISKSASDPTLDFKQSTCVTQAVLELCRKNGVKWIIFPSGSGVYGEYSDNVFNEESPCHPVSPYGASKLASEAMISAYWNMFGLSALVVRLANVVGPFQTHGVGFDFMRRLRADPTRLRILGDGEQTKNYIHVDDVLDAIFFMKEKYVEGYGVYNVSNSGAITVNQIAEMAIEASGLSTADVELEYSGGDRGWNGDVPRITLDWGKIARWGWAPKFNSYEAMRLALKSMV